MQLQWSCQSVQLQSKLDTNKKKKKKNKELDLASAEVINKTLIGFSGTGRNHPREKPTIGRESKGQRLKSKR